MSLSEIRPWDHLETVLFKMGLMRIMWGRGEEVGQHDVIPGWVAKEGPEVMAGSTSSDFGGKGGEGWPT